MNGFTKKELIMSLVCPFLSFLWGVARFLEAIIAVNAKPKDFVGWGAFRLSFVAAILIGGLLPAALTLLLKIHTEEYLKKRLAVIAIIIAIIAVFTHFVMDAARIEIVVSVAGIAAVIYQILKVQEDYSSPGERAVIMLSDPIVYLTIFYAVHLINTIIYLGDSIDWI